MNFNINQLKKGKENWMNVQISNSVQKHQRHSNVENIFTLNSGSLTFSKSLSYPPVSLLFFFVKINRQIVYEIDERRLTMFNKLSLFSHTTFMKLKVRNENLMKYAHVNRRTYCSVKGKKKCIIGVNKNKKCDSYKYT